MTAPFREKRRGPPPTDPGLAGAPPPAELPDLPPLPELPPLPGAPLVPAPAAAPAPAADETTEPLSTIELVPIVEGPSDTEPVLIVAQLDTGESLLAPRAAAPPAAAPEPPQEPPAAPAPPDEAFLDPSLVLVPVEDPGADQVQWALQPAPVETAPEASEPTADMLGLRKVAQPDAAASEPAAEPGAEALALQPIAEAGSEPPAEPLVLEPIAEPAAAPATEPREQTLAPAGPPPGGDPTLALDVAAGQATRAQRQQLGEALLGALHAIQRNARTHADNNDVFIPTIAAALDAVAHLVACDGSFELRTAADTPYVNRQALRLDRKLLGIASSLQREFVFRGLTGLSAPAKVPAEDFRSLVRVFAPGAGRPGPQGLEEHPLRVLRLLVETPPVEDDRPDARALRERLASAYARSVRYIARYVDLLRRGGEALPVWAASRLAMELVDLQRQAPAGFLRLARTKVTGEAYWAFHAVNVAVLAVAVAATCRLPRRRRHELAMAGLFHDVGIAALPPDLLEKKGALDARERGAVEAAPFFAARAVLRERETHPAALARALGVYETHRHGAEAGTAGPLLHLCEAFDAMTSDRPFRTAMPVAKALEVLKGDARYDPHLVPLLAQALRPLLAEGPN